MTWGAQGEALLPRQCGKHTQAGGGGKRGRGGASTRTHERQCARQPPRRRPHERQTVGTVGTISRRALAREPWRKWLPARRHCWQRRTNSSRLCRSHRKTHTHTHDVPTPPLKAPLALFLGSPSDFPCTPVTSASLHFRHVTSFL